MTIKTAAKRVVAAWKKHIDLVPSAIQQLEEAIKNEKKGKKK